MIHDVVIALFTAALGAAGWLALATQKNTMAIMELNIHLRDLIKKVEMIPKIERDLNSLHEWRRDLKKTTTTSTTTVPGGASPNGTEST